MNERIAEPGMQLTGREVPSLALPATTGEIVDLADIGLGDYVLFLYPRTGRPDRPEAEDWALIPGAKGCTAESCEFRDLATDFSRIGLSIYGLSTQDTAYQREAAERLHLPYPLLSDPQMELGRSLGLETFRYDGAELYRRGTLVVRGGVITGSYLRISDPATHPRELLAALSPTAP